MLSFLVSVTRTSAHVPHEARGLLAPSCWQHFECTSPGRRFALWVKTALDRRRVDSAPPGHLFGVAANVLCRVTILCRLVRIAVDMEPTAVVSHQAGFHVRAGARRGGNL